MANESANPSSTYITTPIYYVNDRPHIGHCYTTLVADVAARAARLIGGPNADVFFLTGTDEHAEKVVASAIENNMSPIDWADLNAQRFKDAFEFMGFTNDDFIRTTEDRHTTKAAALIADLMQRGAIELGDYEGWYDPSQEEYLTERVAKEHDYKSPVTGKALEKRVEQNYFFDLPAHESWLKEQIESDAIRILPEARKNEVLGRIKQGLNKVPVSRRIKEGDADWGIPMPADPANPEQRHRVYVWIEALCNYLTAIDTDERRHYWPTSQQGPGVAPLQPAGAQHNPLEPAGAQHNRVIQFMAKDIVWFHAVIWPAMLHALGRQPPTTIYAHAYWIAEGKKMSKSLGNFIEIDQLRAYADKYSLDAVRWYLMTQGPLGATDADFAHSRFIDVYNADLANGIGNSTSRVSNMIDKYFGGELPTSHSPHYLNADLRIIDDDYAMVGDAQQQSAKKDIEGDVPIYAVYWSGEEMNLSLPLHLGIKLIEYVDQYISSTRPFSIAKNLDGEPVFENLTNRESLSTILYQCAEALRIASLFLYPAMPEKMADLWRRWNCDHLNDPADANSGFKAPLEELARFGDGDYSLKPGQQITKGDALFMRADPKEDPPTA